MNKANDIITRLRKKKSLAEGLDSGYTLIEVLIALTIFAVGILSVAKMQYESVRNNTTGNMLTQASLLAESRMEGLKNLVDDDDLAAENGVILQGVDQHGAQGGPYTLTTGVSSTPPRIISVKAEWTRWGRNRDIVLTSATLGDGI